MLRLWILLHKINRQSFAGEHHENDDGDNDDDDNDDNNVSGT